MVDAWAQQSDVLTFTGEEVGDEEILRAQALVELFSGTHYDAVIDSPRNSRLLLRAVAYQAAWMKYHPDIFLNVDVDSVSQDGHSHTPAHENAALLAPLANRCIRRLTWIQKPLRVRGRYGSPNGDDGNRDSAVADDSRAWVPLP